MTIIKKAIDLLNSGDVVGIPTETVYGLAASIESESGIKKIFETKERPFFDPLIVHVSTIEQAKTCVSVWPDEIDKLAKRLWPGPVTFILPKAPKISDMISSGLETVGVRMPNHALTLDLLKQLNIPVAAPSANKFKKTSPTNSQHVKNEFPNVFVLDGGQCSVGIESTILGFKNNELLIYRPGMLSKEILMNIMGELDINMSIKYQQSPVAPGHLKHHYMPKTPIILSYDNDIETINSLDNFDISLLDSPIHWTLPKDSVTAARTLYSKFRELDLKNHSSIIIQITNNQKNSDEFTGIMNRLKKAASFSTI